MAHFLTNGNMVKFTNEHKALINSRYVVVKDEHVCLDCKHTFHDTHYFRKLSHLRNCEQQSEDTQNVINIVNNQDPNKMGDDGEGGLIPQPAKKKQRKGLAPEHNLTGSSSMAPSQMPVQMAVHVPQMGDMQQQVQQHHQQQQVQQQQHVQHQQVLQQQQQQHMLLTEQSAREITDSLVTFFISASIPFGTVESNEFKEFLEAIRPAYAAVVPSLADLERSYSGSN